MGVRVAQETGLGSVSQQRLDHRQGDQLGVGQLGSDPHRGSLGHPLGMLDQQIINRHIYCGSEGVEVRVHTRSSGIGEVFSPRILDTPTPKTVDYPPTPLGTTHLVDPDGDIAGVTWVWERSTDRTTWTPIPDATTNVYTPTSGDTDRYLRVVVTYGDPFGLANTAEATPHNPVTIGHATAFSDVPTEGVHAPAIAALATDGLFVDTECGPDQFCPHEPIQRSTMAIWLIRILGDHPPTVGDSRFDDIAHGQWWIRHVEQLADRNITLGCSATPPRYCPDKSVTRAQMASFLVRALQLPQAQTPAGFTDTEGNVHETNIDTLAAARITLGCDTNPLRYCPDQPVTRAHMATFLHRALNQQTPDNGN